MQTAKLDVVHLDSRHYVDLCIFQRAKECTVMQKKYERLKAWKIENTDIYVVDLLTDDRNKLVSYARNRHVVEAIYSQEYKRRFPLYIDIIKNCFQRGLRRSKLMDGAYRFFHSVIGCPISIDCIEEILKN